MMASRPLVHRAAGTHNRPVTSRRRVHPARPVAAIAFVALVGAAGFRATPSVLIQPLRDEYGWSTATLSAAVSVNLLLYGLTAPFAAALMDKFGLRRVVTAALSLVAAAGCLSRKGMWINPLFLFLMLMLMRRLGE